MDKNDFVSLLADNPSEEDQFSGGGHSRTAAALSNAISQLSDQDAAIGLEGEWGSGKSTVIKIAESKCNASGVNVAFFTFDLWLHQPDQIKRSFLEELLAWSHKNKFVKQNEFIRLSKKISDQSVTTEIDKSKSFSIWATVFLLLTPLLPLIYVWLSPFSFLADKAPENLILFGGDVLKLPIKLLAGGALIAIYLLFAARVFFLKLSSHNSKVESWSSAFTNAANIFSKESDGEKLTQYISANKSSQEYFQSTFREIVKSVRSKKSMDLIVVLDNIDRLPKDDFRRVWAECRSIFAMQPAGESSENAMVTAIVPFDGRIVDAVFFEENSDNNLGTKESLISKTFATVVRVSAPLASDWKQYFEQKLHSCFGSRLDATDEYRLFKLYDISNQQKRQLPTPRGIKSYINSVAMLWNQWHEHIAPANLGLFVMLKPVIEQDPNSLLKPDIISNRISSLLGAKNELVRDLAAIYYNVEPDQALEVILGRDIVAAITEPRSEDFVGLSKSSGFESVLPDTVCENIEGWAAESSDLVCNVIQNVSQLESSETPLDEIWNSIRLVLPQLKPASKFTSDQYQGFVKLIEHSPEEYWVRISQSLLRWVDRSLNSNPEERTSEDGREWLKFYGMVFDVIQHQDRARISLLRDTRVPMGVEFNLGVCAECSKTSAISFSGLQVKEKGAGLGDHFMGLSIADPDLVIDIVASKPKFINAKNATAFVKQLAGKLSQTNTNSLDRETTLRLISTATANLAYAAEVKTVLKPFVQDGTFTWNWKKLSDDKYWVGCGYVLWIITEILEGKTRPTNPGNHSRFGDISQSNAALTKFLNEFDASTEEGNLVAKAIAETIETSDGFPEWEIWALQDKSSKLLQQVLKLLITRGRFKKRSVVESVLNYPEISELIGSELRSRYLSDLNRHSRLFSDKFQDESAWDIPVTFLEDVSTLDEVARGKLGVFGGFVDQAFSNLDSHNEWLDTLQSPDTNRFKLLCHRIEKASYFPPVAIFQATLIEYLRLVLIGDQVNDHDVKIWRVLISGLRLKPSRDKLARDLVIKLADHVTTPAGGEALASTCADLIKLMVLHGKPSIVTERLIAILVQTEAGREVLFENKEAVIACLEKTPEAHVEALHEIVTSLPHDTGHDLFSDAEMMELLGGKAAPEADQS